ncbi:hypothetical protein AMTRI_Chr08g207740 [Amborella trichopoda]
MQERRAKGLCFNCNEKFIIGHRYKKLSLIKGLYEEEDDYDSGGRPPETMRVKGKLGHIAIMVLIDSGSTHNFMSETLAKKVGLQPTNVSRFEVMVASEEKLPSPEKTLGPIMWDFARLFMTFKVAGKEVTLKGVTSFNDKVIRDHEFNHEARRNKKGMLLHL